MQFAERRQPLEQAQEALFDVVHLLAGQLLHRFGVLEQVGVRLDLRQRKPQVLQGQDTVEHLHVVVGVEALVLRPFRRRRKQSLLVVVLDGPHRHADAARKLSHRQVFRSAHGLSLVARRTAGPSSSSDHAAPAAQRRRA